MILREAVYAIKTIIKENNIDSIIEDEFIINRLNVYRSMAIENEFTRKNRFDKNWIQDLGVFTSEIVNSADDPLISRTSVAMARVEIPQTIELKNLNTLTVMTGSKQQRINEISMDRLFNMIQLKDEMLNNLKAYFRIGQNLYLYPIVKYVSVSGILQNPLDGYTTKELIDTNGLVVSPAGTKRNLTIDDEYPFDNASLGEAIINMLRIDYNIMRVTKEDFMPDGLPEKDIE